MSTERIKIIDNLFQEAINRKIDFRDALELAFADHKREVESYDAFWGGGASDRFIERYLNMKHPRYQAVVACFTEQIGDMERILREKHENDMRLASLLQSNPNTILSPESVDSRSQRDIQHSMALNNQIRQVNTAWNLLGTDVRGAQVGNTTMGARQHTHETLSPHPRPALPSPTPPPPTPPPPSEEVIPPVGRVRESPLDLLRWIPVMFEPRPNLCVVIPNLDFHYLHATIAQGIPADNRFWDFLTRTFPVLNGDATRSARISGSVNLFSCICQGYNIYGDEMVIDTDINPSGEQGGSRSSGHRCEDNGSQQNAARHTLWVAAMTRNYGRRFAQMGSDAHEYDPYILRNHPNYPNYEYMRFASLYDADTAVDLLNNQIGIRIGMEEGSGEVRDIMYEVLDEFYRGDGLWVVRPNIENGETISYSIERQRISHHHFNYAMRNLSLLDSEGRELPEPETGSVQGFGGSPGNQ